MKKNIKCYLHYNTSKYEPGYQVWAAHMTSSTDLILAVVADVEFEVPDNFDPRPAQIKALQKKQTEAAAAFHAMTVENTRLINELQALEMTV